jgi:SAM-dependent methyltransferase
MNGPWVFGYGEEYKFKTVAEYCFGKILDVGCAQKPNEFLPRPVTGLDILPLSRWQTLPKNYIKQIVGDATKISLNEKFDCITACELIEHLRDPCTFIEKCYDWLQPKGRLIILTDNPYRFQTLFGNILNPKGIGKSSDYRAADLGHINFFVPRMLNTLANESGFKVLNVQCGGGLPLPFLQQKFIYVYEKRDKE